MVGGGWILMGVSAAVYDTYDSMEVKVGRGFFLISFYILIAISVHKQYLNELFCLENECRFERENTNGF